MANKELFIDVTPSAQNPFGKVISDLYLPQPIPGNTLAEVLAAGNTTQGIDILGSSSNIETDALKCVSIRPLAFPLETNIIIDGNLAMEDNTNINFGTDVLIKRNNQDVLKTDGSTNVIFLNCPKTSVAPVSGVDLCNKTYVDNEIANIPPPPTPSLAQVMDVSSVASQNLLMNSNDIIGFTDISGINGYFDSVFSTPVTDAQISLNKLIPSSQQLIANTYYINDNVTDIQTVYNAHSAEQGVCYKIGSGSYGGSTLTINNSSNILFECPNSGNGSTLTELASNRGLTITNSARIRFTALQIEGNLTVDGQYAGPPIVSTNSIFSNCEILGSTNLGTSTAITGFITFYQCTFAGPITYNLGTATVYFVNCSFNNQTITNTGLPTRIIITNGAGMNSIAQTNYIGYGQLVSNAGVSLNVQNQLATPFNSGSISSAQIEVSSDPSTSNALARKSYVDTKISSVSAGNAGISISGTTAVTISNNGVLDISSTNPGISITGNKSTTYYINNTGVTSLIAGDNITLSSATGAITISSSGGGGGGNHENIALLNSISSLTESGALALPLSDSSYNYQIEDTHFGDAHVSLSSIGEIVILGGGASGTRTFSIQLQFRLDTNAASSAAGPITFFLVDYANQERFFCGEFDPQAFLTAKQIFFYNETFTLTLPYSSSNRTYKLYIKDDVNKWQNGGSITQWTVTNVKTSIWYYGQIGFNANIPSAFTPPISVAPSITSISATGSNTILINWSNVSGAENYYIYRSTDNISFTLVYVISSIYNTYTDTGLNASTTYYYKVGAQNDEGVGPLSPSANATTEASSAPTFSEYWTDGRAPYTNFGGSYIHPSSDAIILSAVMVKLGSGPTSIYMIRREDYGGWSEGQQFSPVTIKNGFPGAGTPLQGEFTTRGQMLSLGGGGCTWDIPIAGVTWNIGQTKAPYNLPYNVSTNPYGYSSWP